MSPPSSASPIRMIPRGWGHYLPKKVISNADLSKTLETSDEWIRQRTGIRQRHIADDNETTLTLAEHASRQALQNAGWDASEIDLIIVATATPDRSFPAVACLLQHALGCRAGGAAFDIHAACSGFIYGLSVADALAKSGGFGKILLVGAETFSRILDWDDRRTAILFGDGAGAVACEVSHASGEGASETAGVLSTHLFADGRHAAALQATGGVSLTRTAGVVEMDGREVYRHAVVRMAEAIEVALDANGLSASDINWFVPHQANLRLMETMVARLGLPKSQMLAPVERHANTSAASIPLAISEAAAQGKFKAGDLLLLEALGAGFTWGSALLRW